MVTGISLEEKVKINLQIQEREASRFKDIKKNRRRTTKWLKKKKKEAL